MVNPANPEVREYQLAILEEFARKYPTIDGIIFDRVRYDDIWADFSPLSLADFATYAGLEKSPEPKDIMTWYEDENGKWRHKPATYFKEWMEYRAGVIKSFVEEAHKRIKAINPNLLLGDYTGAWYPTYYYVGVNWASEKYNPAEEFEWASENYYKTGYADLLDVYMTGLYYTPITKHEVDTHFPDIGQRMEAGMDAEARNYWYCVEGAAELAQKITCGVVPVVGSIYVEQYMGDEERFGRAVASEMALVDIDCWLAPGVNIHRNPLCGRNFEYFSEDPLVAGLMGAAVVKGVQTNTDGTPSGRSATVKHFAVNNQEFERGYENNIVDEKTLREIYLKPFEIVVRKAHPNMVMSSYSRLNGDYCATTYDLMTGVLREEWGFDGFVMTDWWNSADKLRHAEAGNDLVMPGVRGEYAALVAALKDGKVRRADVQHAAVNILKTYVRIALSRKR
jgi:hypothetical protein